MLRTWVRYIGTLLCAMLCLQINISITQQERSTNELYFRLNCAYLDNPLIHPTILRSFWRLACSDGVVVVDGTGRCSPVGRCATNRPTGRLPCLIASLAPIDVTARLCAWQKSKPSRAIYIILPDATNCPSTLIYSRLILCSQASYFFHAIFYPRWASWLG